MPIGPGKYDEFCTLVQEKTEARGVLLIVLGGNRGFGFSCQADLEVTMTLPEILEDVARQIRRDGPFAQPKA